MVYPVSLLGQSEAFIKLLTNTLKPLSYQSLLVQAFRKIVS